MADYINKSGMGTLFPNSYKTGPNHPDYKGSMTLETGEVVRFAAWSKEGAKGPYLSLKIDKPRTDAVDAFRGGGDAGVSGGQAGGSSRGPVAFDLDDDIPFARCDAVW